MNFKVTICVSIILLIFGNANGSFFGGSDKEDNKKMNNNTENLYDKTSFNTKLILLHDSNTVTIRGPIGPMSTTKFISDIHKKDTDDVYVFLTTPGGSVIHGYQIIQVIDALNKMGKNVYCIADVAYSMGFGILQACPTRFAMTGSSIMQHQMSFGIKGQLENNKNRMTFIEEIESQMTERQSKRLGLSVEEFKEKTLSDWWLFGRSIIENKGADEMVNVLCDKSLTEKFYTEEYDLLFFGKIYIDFSECPLISDPLKVYFKDVDTNNTTQITDSKKISQIMDDINNNYIKNYQILIH